MGILPRVLFLEDLEGSMRKNSKTRRRKETESLVALETSRAVSCTIFRREKVHRVVARGKVLSTACTWSLQVATLPSPPHTQHSYSILYSFSPYSTQSDRISEFRMHKQLPRSRSCEPLNR